MATFTQGAGRTGVTAFFVLAQGSKPPVGLPVQTLSLHQQLITSSPSSFVSGPSHTPSGAGGTFQAQERMESSIGHHFFDKMHVVPRAFDFGNLLSDQSVAIEVFNAYLYTAQTWATFVNNAGSGVELGGEPTLPETIEPLNGVTMTLDVSAAGDAFVDATLDFGFTGLDTIYVPIEIQRIVLWGAYPEMPYTEELEFLTKVHESKDGTERRVSHRKCPRQSWIYDYLIDEGTEAQTLENLMFDFQSLTFGVPDRLHATELTVAAAAADTVINVGSTANRDFREGGLVAIYTDQSTFDALPIAVGGITATTITLSAPVVGSYAIGTEVAPLPTCRTGDTVRGKRWPSALQGVSIRFEAVDNDVDLGDLSAFDSFNSKMLLSNGNSIAQETMEQRFTMRIERIDGAVGLVYQDSSYGRNKRVHMFTLRAEGRQAVWEMRRMVYGIGGRWKSFYVPRDSDDLVAVADLTSGSDTMNVTNVGYSQHVRERQPRNIVRVSFVDGSTPLIRTVTASTALSSTVDQLTVDSNWPSTVTPAEISRIEYVEEVRFDTDKIRIKYADSGLLAFMTVPIKVLFE